MAISAIRLSVRNLGGVRILISGGLHTPGGARMSSASAISLSTIRHYVHLI